MQTIDLDAIIDETNWLGSKSREVAKELMKKAIHQALVLAAENAKCIDEGNIGGDGEWHSYYIVDKQSILDTEKLIK